MDFQVFEIIPKKKALKDYLVNKQYRGGQIKEVEFRVSPHTTRISLMHSNKKNLMLS